MSANEAKQENILGTEKIGKLLVIFAVPGIVSMVVNSFYNIVDQIFIGKGVGTLGNGATNVVFPLTTLALAFAMMIGNGAGAYMSLMLGRKEDKEAAKGSAAGMAGIIVVGVILGILYMIFLEPLCRMFGATENILPYALTYGRITCLGTPFLAISAGYSSVIRSDGSPKYNMIGLLTGCIINIILDPLFIFVFKLGVAGAAYATIIGQMANAVIALSYIPKFKTIKITKDLFPGCMSSMGKVLNLGFASFISQFVVVIAMAVQNNILVMYGATSKYGEDIPMTALGVTMKIFSILMAVVMGLSAGAQPIFGYNYGARRYDRVKETFRYVLGISISVMTVAFILFRICPAQIISIFGNDSALYEEFSIKCLQIFLMMIPLGAIHMVSGNFFQALGRPNQASLISLSKQILFQIPFSAILPRFIGVEGVLWAGACSDLLSFILCVFLLRKYWGIMFKEDGEEQEFHYDFASGKGFLGDGQVAGPNAPNVIITIGRTLGSGGKNVGQMLAKQLDIPYYDGEILQQASERSGLSARYMQSVNESVRSYRLIYNITALRDANVMDLNDIRKKADQAQNEIIEQAAQGPCVIVGRRADQLLRNRDNVIRVFITEDMERRAIHVAEDEGTSVEAAAKRLALVDMHRANYYGELDGKVWGHADNYDVCLNTGSFGLDGAVDMVLHAIERKKLFQAQNAKN